MSVCQELDGNREECILGPRMEPINDGKIDKSWELSGSTSKRLSDWRETEGHMKVLLDSIDEEVPTVVF